MTDLRQSKNWACFLRASGWQVVGSPGNFISVRHLPLTPIAVIKIQRPSFLNFAAFDRQAKKHRAFWVYLEPINQSQAVAAQKHGFRPSHSPFLPTKTIRLDLKPPLKKIKAQMKKDARYCLRQAEKQNLQLARLTKKPDLSRFQAAWPRRRGWKPSLKNLLKLKAAFNQKAIFLAALDQNQIIAGTVILVASNQAYYYYAFTNPSGRRKLAQYWLVWQAIKIAKKLHLSVFDFEGIFDPRFSAKSWHGFSHFKRSFGGQEITYPGCLVSSRLRKASGIHTNHKTGSAGPENHWRRFPGLF